MHNMGDNWYCLIFGEELGPMSWNDLVAMAAHGTLGRRERVRRETTAEWRAAELIPGLFSNDSAAPANTPLTMPTDDADFDLAPSIQPNPSEDTDFDVAEPPASLSAPADDADFDLAPPIKPAPTGSADDAEFDVTSTALTPPLAAPADDADFDLAPSMKPASPEDTDFEVAEPPPAGDADFDLASPLKPALAAETGVAAEAPQQTRAETSLAASNDAGLEAAPPVLASLADETPRPAKKPKQASGGGLSESSRRAAIYLVGAVAAIGSAYLIYLGVVALAVMRGPNYDEILTGYDQLFQQAQAARSDSSVLGNPRATMEFLARLKTLRSRLRDGDANSADSQLAEAGNLLAQLYATAEARPGSQEAHERRAVENEYLTKISAVRGKLAK